LFIAGCASSTVNKAIKNGAKRLAVEEIYTLVDNNTLRLESANFDAYIFYAKDGLLAAGSQVDTADSGHWDIKSDSTLCIKFQLWYFGDINCYSVYQEPEQDDYLLFTNNGALAYKATLYAGNPKDLTIKRKNGEEEKFVRSSLSKGQNNRPVTTQVAASTPMVTSPPVIESTGPAATSEEINTTVQNMARNCPGCNLKDADLRQANLMGANLKRANLQGADLSRANLRRANLEGADLSGATLLSANLPGANLKNTNLSGADLTGSNLIQADLTGATLSNCILTNTLQEGSIGLQGVKKR
jgi:uncharacterized protein YjbI with pentapeptide repeats